MGPWNGPLPSLSMDPCFCRWLILVLGSAFPRSLNSRGLTLKLLLGRSDVGHLFCDVHNMCQPKAFDVKKNADVLTPCCDILVAGFPCQDCSVLNPHSSSDANRACITKGAQRTRSVYGAILEYAAAFKKQPKAKSNGKAQDLKSNGDELDRSCNSCWLYLQEITRT